MNYLLNLEVPETFNEKAADANENGDITFEVVAPTGIEMIENEPEATTRYDFMGRTIAQHQGFFENGKKMLAK